MRYTYVSPSPPPLPPPPPSHIWQAPYMDTVGVNMYISWYEYPGHPETIPYKLSAFLENWYAFLKKPVYMSEYGAGTIDGFHKVIHIAVCAI